MTAKNIVLKPISNKEASDLIKKVHYSGKSTNNSQIHIGVFYYGKLEGAMQFGPSLDKSKIQGIVKNTGWNEFIELNRMAFTDALPQNSESRAISIAMKILKKHCPHLKWVISFADACQCGDGTIYRASGFVLTGIKKNTQMWESPDGTAVFSRASLTNHSSPHVVATAKKFIRREDNTKETGAASMKQYQDAGFKPLPGYQLRYIYFLDQSVRKDLTVSEIPFSKIKEIGASMYLGKRASENRTNP